MAAQPRPSNRGNTPDMLDDAAYPGYAMGAAAAAIEVTPAFLRAAEAAGLFEAHRSEGGHRRYSRDDLHRADRARRLVDDGIPMDAAVRIVSLEIQLATAQAMLDVMRRKPDPPARPGRQMDADRRGEQSEPDRRGRQRNPGRRGKREE